MKDESGGRAGVLRQLTDGRITTLHQHPFTPDVGPDEYCGDWELAPPDAALGLPASPARPGTGVVSSDGNTLHFVEYTTGKLFRSLNIRAAAADVVYEDCGVIDANGIVYLTLDSFDPANKAMACGDDGIWRTSNFGDALPTWTKVYDAVVSGNKWHRFKQAASSILQQDRWAVVARYWNGDQNDWFCFVLTTDDFGDNWVRTGIDSWAENCGLRPTIELSSHDVDKAWITWVRSTDEAVSYTDDFFSTHVSAAIPNLHNSTHPCSYHRFLDNASDQNAIWGGKSAAGAAPANVALCTADYGTCTSASIHTAAAGDARWVGGYTWGESKYWALIYLVAGDYEFAVSDDALTWTVQAVLPGTTRFVSGWPYDGQYFYATQDGATAPILVSSDRGVTWQAQTGNWGTVGPGATSDVYCCVPKFAE
jgi:hypothetical protein